MDTKKNKTIADRLAELREICRQENYRLPTSRRTTRENALVKVLDELAGMQVGIDEPTKQQDLEPAAKTEPDGND